MFSKTHTSYSPWIIVQANDKKRARLESMRHVLARSQYAGKGETGTPLAPDPDIVTRYHRAGASID